MAPSQNPDASIKPRMGHTLLWASAVWLWSRCAGWVLTQLLEWGQSPKPQDSAMSSAYSLLRQTFKVTQGRSFARIEVKVLRIWIP